MPPRDCCTMARGSEWKATGDTSLAAASSTNGRRANGLAYSEARSAREKRDAFLRGTKHRLKWNSSRDNKWHNHRYRSPYSPFEIRSNCCGDCAPANCIKHAVCRATRGLITRLRFADPICVQTVRPVCTSKLCPTNSELDEVLRSFRQPTTYGICHDNPTLRKGRLLTRDAIATRCPRQQSR